MTTFVGVLLFTFAIRTQIVSNDRQVVEIKTSWVLLGMLGMLGLLGPIVIIVFLGTATIGYKCIVPCHKIISQSVNDDNDGPFISSW